MRIAILNIYQEKVERGAETFVREIAKRLRKNHTVEIISSEATPLPRFPIVWRLFLDPNGIQILFFTLKKLPYLLSQKFDVVIPVNGGWQSFLVRLVTWFYGGKMVISGQSGIGWDDAINLWSFPDVFVALSSYAQKWAIKVNPFVKVSYIPNGVDIEKFRKSQVKLELNLPHPIILCVAALEKSKRIELAIAAVSKIKNASLLVVGRGSLREKLEKRGRKLLGGRFKIIKAKYSDMPKVYNSCDIFTLPSCSFHSFEIVLVEAMACNLPVVANDDPIRKEIVGDAGILIDPTDASAYSKALQEAINKNWGERPRRQAEKFSWEKIASRYENLFKELIRQKIN